MVPEFKIGDTAPDFRYSDNIFAKSRSVHEKTSETVAIG